VLASSIKIIVYDSRAAGANLIRRNMPDGFNSKNASHNPKGLIFAEGKEAAVEISRRKVIVESSEWFTTSCHNLMLIALVLN
jgi:hypothetical protein